VRRGPRFIAAVVVGVFAFLAISFLLARSLTGANAERADILGALRAQAAGDANGTLARMPACAQEPACAQTTRARVARLKRPGQVEIVRFDPSVQATLTRRIGTARVVWRAGAGRPVVQCARVRRDGPLTGGGAQLLSLSDPIGGEASCP
jgi:hypothetical protein